MLAQTYQYLAGILLSTCLIMPDSGTHAQGTEDLIVTRTMFMSALLDDYDSAVNPTFDKDFPTEVYVSLHINGINDVNEQKMDFSVNMYLIQSWNDYRLAFRGLIDSDMVEIDSKLISKFWVPDLHFVNEKSSDFHDVTVPNRLLHLYRDGTVVYKIRLTVTASCEMDLRDFPFDQQNCSLYIKSFGYSNQSLQLSWSEAGPVSHKKNLRMSQFTLQDLRHRECNDEPDMIVSEGYNGSDVFNDKANPLFSCLAVDFILHRSIGFYAIQIYIPSALIVVLSWVSFVLDVAAVPARISLGILTVLTMTNMKSIAVSSLPKLSYIKAIDVWMAVCLGFVFASLIEFAIVNAVSRKKLSTDVSSVAEMEPLKGGSSAPVVSVSRRHQCLRTARDRARGLDRVSLVLFPASFMLFIVIYLIKYLVE